MKNLIVIFTILLTSCSKTSFFEKDLNDENNCFFDPGILSSVCEKNKNYFLKWKKIKG